MSSMRVIDFCTTVYVTNMHVTLLFVVC